MTRYINCFAAVVLALSIFPGCEWSTSGSDDSWDDSSSWVNFSGMYKQAAGSLVVSGWATTSSTSTNGSSGGSSSSVSGTTGTSTEQVGSVVGGGNNRSFSGTLTTRPILPSSVSVTDGVEQLRDNGAGVLTSSRSGSGTINYISGAISVLFELPPVAGRAVMATYSWSTTNASSSSSSSSGSSSSSVPNNQVSDQSIFSFFVSQQGNKLYIRDNNGVEYSGELGSVANTGGETTGMTSGYIIAQFTAVDADGNQLLGTFQGDYIAPEVPANADTVVSASGLLANRTMQGTYMHHNGTSNGDINAIAADDIQITINPYAPASTNATNTAAN